MSKEHKKLLAIIDTIHRNVNDKKWDCVLENCNEKAINSHLLQQKGILDKIVENGYLVQLSRENIFESETQKFIFKEIGVNGGVSLRLFCKKHDVELFKEIETKPIDFNDYRTPLLFSYRATCAEIRKKEKVIETSTKMLDSNILALEYRDSNYANNLKQLINGSKLGIKDLSFYKNEFEKCLADSDLKQFEFTILKYHPLQVCTSTLSSPVLPQNENNPKFAFQEKVWNSFFINVIPQTEHLYIIIGYHKDYVDNWILSYIDSWRTDNKEQQQINLTELFATRILVWAMSKSLFASIPKQKVKTFENFWNKNSMNLSTKQRFGFNLFSD